MTRGEPRIPMASMDIETRLENWGACQRGRSGGAMVARESRRSSSNSGQGYKCMTDVICNMLRLAASGPAGGHSGQSKLDFTDAETINTAWIALKVRHKTILKDLYALNRPVNVICREMDIRHWPASHFKAELLDAQNAIYKLTLRNK